MKGVSLIREDLAMFCETEGSSFDLKSSLKFALLTPGFQFVMWHRLGEVVRGCPLIGRILRRLLWLQNCKRFGSEIALGAEIGGGFYVPHPYGIVIGECIIGKNVTVLQGVTIGKRSEGDTSKPQIGNRCTLGAGAVILGAVSLGDGAVVAANAVLLQDVPENAVAVGVPAKVLVRPGDIRHSDGLAPNSSDRSRT